MKNTFKKMKMTPKLILAFVLVVIISSISGVTGAVVMKNSDRNYSSALVINGFTQGTIGQFTSQLYKVAGLTRDMIMVTDSAEKEALYSDLQTAQKAVDQAYEETLRNCNTPEEIEIMDRIKEELPAYRDYRDRVIELGLANKNDEAFRMFHEEARPRLLEIMTEAEALVQLNVTIGNEVSDSLTKASSVSVLMIIVMIAVSTVLSIVFASFFAKSITKRLKVVEKAAGKLAQGDLEIEVSESEGDEINSMQNSFAEAVHMLGTYIKDIDYTLDAMGKGYFDVAPSVVYKGNFRHIEQSLEKIIDSMGTTLGGITEASSQVSAGADQVSSGAQALSQGATEQASSVEELAATINEISHHIQETAEHAKAAQNENETTHDELQNCSSQMGNMVHAMDAISDKSKEISKIVKSIEDIAFQTNILALNAAVEAARAGEAGKGFAVVADEVRNLAAKSAESAKNTTILIEETVQAVEEGSRLSAETEISLSKVVESEQKSMEAISYISKMANEQASNIAQVTVGIDQISSVVQTNSATAEESAAASEELSGQANMLLDLVRHFRFKEDGVSFMGGVAISQKDNSFGGYSQAAAPAGAEKY